MLLYEKLGVGIKIDLLICPFRQCDVDIQMSLLDKIGDVGIFLAFVSGIIFMKRPCSMDNK